MIVSLHNSKQHEHMGHHNIPPCASESECSNNDVIASMLNSMAPNHRNHTLRFRVTDQTESAIIYVAVVVVFYAAIIILLLGTSSRRPHRSRSRSRHRSTARSQLKDHLKQPTVAVYVDDHDRTEVQVQSSHESLKTSSDSPKTVAPL